MPSFVPDTAFDKLVDDLQAAFMKAATQTGRDLHDELVTALVSANVVPESYRSDFDGVVRCAPPA